MTAKLCQIVLLASLVASSQQLSKPTDNSYVAAVVEFPTQTGTPLDKCKKATQGFLNILEDPVVADVDIIVFPEYVLNSDEVATFVPDPSLKITPCYSPDYEVFLVDLSCAARARGVYVVLNLHEKELCANGTGSDTYNPCPPNGIRYFNTNVVLDRRGRIISRYRKTHLWRREYNTKAVLRQPDLSTFETDFGVTFGHFICFDMLFYEPAMQLVRDLKITDIIYPTFWFSELPFLTAVQLQEGWAFANDINLLAADGSEPEIRTTGSGIYAGRAGRIDAGIFETATQKIFKARVPKRSNFDGAAYELPPKVIPAFTAQAVTTRYTKLATFRDSNVEVFETKLIPDATLSVQEKLCHREFCCNFEIERRAISISANAPYYRYRIAAYHGNETSFIGVDRCEEAICAIFACTTDELFSCARIFPTSQSVENKHFFEKIHITAQFPAAKRRLIIPSTLNGVMLPLDVAQYKWSEDPVQTNSSTSTQIGLELLSPVNDLLSFGIWANYYTELPTTHNLDHLQPGQGGNSAASQPWVATLVTLGIGFVLLNSF